MFSIFVDNLDSELVGVVAKVEEADSPTVVVSAEVIEANNGVVDGSGSKFVGFKVKVVVSEKVLVSKEDDELVDDSGSILESFVFEEDNGKVVVVISDGISLLGNVTKEDFNVDVTVPELVVTVVKGMVAPCVDDMLPSVVASKSSKSPSRPMSSTGLSFSKTVNVQLL